MKALRVLISLLIISLLFANFGGQHWGETGLTGWIREDANEDGAVNVLDMIIIGQHWTG